MLRECCVTCFMGHSQVELFESDIHFQSRPEEIQGQDKNVTFNLNFFQTHAYLSSFGSGFDSINSCFNWLVKILFRINSWIKQKSIRFLSTHESTSITRNYGASFKRKISVRVRPIFEELPRQVAVQKFSEVEACPKIVWTSYVGSKYHAMGDAHQPPILPLCWSNLGTDKHLLQFVPKPK